MPQLWQAAMGILVSLGLARSDGGEMGGRGAVACAGTQVQEIESLRHARHARGGACWALFRGLLLTPRFVLWCVPRPGLKKHSDMEHPPLSPLIKSLRIFLFAHVGHLFHACAYCPLLCLAVGLRALGRPASPEQPLRTSKVHPAPASGGSDDMRRDARNNRRIEYASLISMPLSWPVGLPRLLLNGVAAGQFLNVVRCIACMCCAGGLSSPSRPP